MAGAALQFEVLAESLVAAGESDGRHLGGTSRGGHRRGVGWVRLPAAGV